MNKFLHNNIHTDLDNLDSEGLKAYYEAQPSHYYQQYVAGSVSPYYNLNLAALGASEELMELLVAMEDKNADDFISEAGDFLFQLYNVANFANIQIKLPVDNPKTSPSTKKDLYKNFNELVGAIMKKARYEDFKTVFQNKYGMTFEERLESRLYNILKDLIYFCFTYNFTLKDIMDYNLEKLDRRHASDKYEFGAGYHNTRKDGGTFGR